LGNALTSQCDTDDQPMSGFGVYSSGRPNASAPALREASKGEVGDHRDRVRLREPNLTGVGDGLLEQRTLGPARR
jgi:hypothetical protein